MFGIFKGKGRKIVQAAANIATLLNTCFWSIRRDNDGDLPKEFQTDKYVLGYIVGVTGAGAYMLGINKPYDTGLLHINVLKLFFPDNSEEIATKTLKFANIKDQIFVQGRNNGVDESAVIYKAMMSGDEEAVKNTVGALKSLERHLNENYQLSAT